MQAALGGTSGDLLELVDGVAWKLTMSETYGAAGSAPSTLCAHDNAPWE